MTSAHAQMRSFILTMALTEGLMLLMGSRYLVNLIYKHANPIGWLLVLFALFGMFMCIYGPFVSSGRALQDEIKHEAREQTPFDAKSELVSFFLPLSFLLMGISQAVELPGLWISPAYPVAAKGIVTAIIGGFIGICLWASGDRFLRWRIALRQEKENRWKAL